MRDDRYTGTALPRPVKALMRMADREADRAHPERLREKAVQTLCRLGRSELEPEFLRRLKREVEQPSLPGSGYLEEVARHPLEADICADLRRQERRSFCDEEELIKRAFERQADRYQREQKAQLVADRDPNAAVIASSVNTALRSAAEVASIIVASGGPIPKGAGKVDLKENLLGSSQGMSAQ